VDVELRSVLAVNMRSIAAQLEALADTLTPSSVGQVDFGADGEDFLPGQKTVEDLNARLRSTMEALGTRLGEFVADVSTLEVRTYVADQLGESDQSDPFEDARLCAMSSIKLDGDTRILIPGSAGALDPVVWDVHSKTVEHAQANRAAMLKTIGELLAGLLPTGK
jgi:hypothetical protein